MGYHDSLKKTIDLIDNGDVKVAIDGGWLTFSGKTYDIKEFLKKELEVVWHKDSKCWRVRVAKLYDGDRNLMVEILGYDWDKGAKSYVCGRGTDDKGHGEIIAEMFAAVGEDVKVAGVNDAADDDDQADEADVETVEGDGDEPAAETAETATGGKGAFRAMRETIGLTQRQVADALDVNIVTEKRWESPSYPTYPVPDYAWAYIGGERAAQIGRIEAAVDEAADATDVALDYYHDARHFAEVNPEADPDRWNVCNSDARQIADALACWGKKVNFKYATRVKPIEIVDFYKKAVNSFYGERYVDYNGIEREKVEAIAACSYDEIRDLLSCQMEGEELDDWMDDYDKFKSYDWVAEWDELYGDEDDD